MRAASLFAFALFVVASPAAAAETEPPVAPGARPGLALAARVGAAAPIGVVFVGSGTMNDTIALDVPVGVELGYRLYGGHLRLGAFGEIGAVVPRGCGGQSGACSGHDLRAGALVAYHFAPLAPLDPWLGAGVSYERLVVKRQGDRESLDLTAGGMSFVDLHAGLAVAVSRSLRVGPFASASLGRYTSVTLDGRDTNDFDRGLHAWVVVGIRGDWTP